jgi:very-short-patch-repair endonuclease
LILHAQNPYAFTKQFEAQAQETESEFERQVLRRLMQAEYRVVPQWKVGAYRIDLVVEGGGKRLAVECDGERWHGPAKLADDMARQAILERLGWRFARIRGSQFFRDPDGAMKPVFAKLEALGIPPEGRETSPTDPAREGEELKERVIRRAAELRSEWTNSNPLAFAVIETVSVP